MALFLETDRIVFRHIEPEQGHLFFDLNSDPEVMRYLTDGRPDTQKDIDEIMERVAKLRVKFDDKYGNYFAFQKSNDEFMGWFCLRPGHDQPENFDLIEIGYRLKQKFWGQGYATEGALALRELAFIEYKTPKVFAIAMLANKGSSNVMKKIGLKFSHRYTETKFPGEDKRAVWYEMENPYL